MYTITFYSFKGGVGRTLALVNVGAELARRGRKVLLVDFDLEAPGLETFDSLRPPQPHPGIVEYVSKYWHTMYSPDVQEYIYPANLNLKKYGPDAGQLWVMPAGCRNAAYEQALTSIDWNRLYGERDGFVFFEDTKAQWEQELRFDYVLIDSRTGHTDVKGICTRQLPDAVVVLFFPNEQNLTGLRAVCQEIRAQNKQGWRKAIGLHFVMSNVPDLGDEQNVLRIWRRKFEKALGIQKLSAVIHRYESDMLYNQGIVVLQRPKGRLAREYRKLTRAIVGHNPGDPGAALEYKRRYGDVGTFEADKYWEEDEKLAEEQGLLAPDKLGDEIVAHFWGKDADVIYEMSEYAGDKKAEFLNHVLELNPDHEEALFRRGSEADMLRYLNIKGLESPRGLHALRRLQGASPSRFFEAVELAVARGITPNSKYELARLLGETDAGLPRAIEFMRDYALQSRAAEHMAAGMFLLQSYLIRAQRWNEVDKLYESHKDDSAAEALAWAWPFNAAMAHWAHTGSVSEDLWDESLARLGKSISGGLLGKYGPVVWLQEGACWLQCWRGGRQEAALRLLGSWIEQIEQWKADLDEIIHCSWWSFWRYQGVQTSQYLEDCQQLRRMMQGEPIRPAFLDTGLVTAEPRDKSPRSSN